MTDHKPTVFIIDDDPAVRHSVSVVVESVGLCAQCHEDANSFLDSYNPDTPGCLVLDVRLPGMTGLELYTKLLEEGYHIPTIVMSGYGEISMAVQALQAGAIDFIEKPFSGLRLLKSINKAISLDENIRRERADRSSVEEKLATLTFREREVMDMLVAGDSSKTVAYKLKISSKTVDFHRARIQAKMGVDTLIQLVLLLQKLPSKPTLELPQYCDA